MTIELKFKEGDKIHFLHENKALSSTVRGYKIAKYPKQVEEITYLCGEKEDDVRVLLKVPAIGSFQSKEELLKSL
jgi:hypothetical protein